ncbi:acyltransferase family protein [Bradyrhizobium sp. dw_78]|uniref:acyltransferase family protein n=1 Tax=Bradyrhizobium sp. dw_78 TaxID=2719793 RepID=UPI001BD22FD7|nr:acyltransferase family protein [Bradyrhizobium sp. dw_78]
MKAGEYRKDIDSLRAVAVMMVLVFHFELFGAQGAGFLGVDIFFVISGFLITSIVKRQLDDGTFDLRQFYANRIRRLAPALFTVMALTLCMGMVWLLPRQLTDLGKEAMAAQTYLSNFYYWRTINYFGLSANSAFFLHTWSLAVEEQYYLLYPIFLIAVHRIAKRRFWLALGLVLIVSFLINIYFVDKKPEATFYLLPTRAWEFLVGALTSRIASIYVSQAEASLIFLTGLALIGASAIFLNRDLPLPGYYAAIPVLGAAFTLFAGDKCSLHILRAFNASSIRYLGKISYSLYLVHWPVVVFARSMLGTEDNLPWRVVLFLSSIGLAVVIYHLVENPIRNRKAFAASRQLASAYGLGLICSILFCAVILATGGLPQRFPGPVIDLAAYTDDKTPPLTQCEFSHQSLNSITDLCMIGSNTAPRWLIYGDSHAWAGYQAFDIWLKRTKQSAVFMFQHSCPPLRGVHLYHDQDRCFNFNEQIFNVLAKSPAISKVLLVSIWRQGKDGIATSKDIVPTQASASVLFKEAFPKTVADLKALGKDVYIWEPLPGAREDVPIFMARAAMMHLNRELEFSRDEYLSDFSFFFDVLNSLRTQVSGRLSSSRALCGSGICMASLDGKPLYFDTNHPTASSAEFWADLLVRMERGASPS